MTTLDTTKVVTLADLAAGWEIIGVSRAGQHICWVTDPEELLPTLSGLMERGNQIASVTPVAALRRLDALSSIPEQGVWVKAQMDAELGPGMGERIIAAAKAMGDAVDGPDSYAKAGASRRAHWNWLAQLALAPSKPAAVGAIEAAARDLVASRSESYRAGNNRQVSLQDQDGEKMWIVPFDEMAALEAALRSTP